jgi:hypothetical protein
MEIRQRDCARQYCYSAVISPVRQHEIPPPIDDIWIIFS